MSAMAQPADPAGCDTLLSALSAVDLTEFDVGESLWDADVPPDQGRRGRCPGRPVLDWTGAEREGPRRGDRWQDHRRRRHVPGAGRGQGRPGRPQRRRQDHPLQDARWGLPRQVRKGHSRRGDRLPLPGPTSRGGPRRHQLPHPRAVRPRPRRGRDQPREAPDRPRGGPVGPQHREVLRRPGAIRERWRLRRRLGGPAPRRRPRPAPGPPRPHPRCALRRGTAPPRAGAHPLRRQRPAPAR